MWDADICAQPQTYCHSYCRIIQPEAASCDGPCLEPVPTMTGLQCQQSSLVIWIGVSGHHRARNARYGGRVPCLLSELGCVGRGCGLEFVSPKGKGINPFLVVEYTVILLRYNNNNNKILT